MSPRIASFDWDEANLDHIARHDVTREEVEQAFLDSYSFLLRHAIRNQEQRYETVGETRDGRILLTVMTVRNRQIRTVTAYTASEKQTAAYWQRRNHGK